MVAQPSVGATSDLPACYMELECEEDGPNPSVIVPNHKLELAESYKDDAQRYRDLLPIYLQLTRVNAQNVAAYEQARITAEHLRVELQKERSRPRGSFWFVAGVATVLVVELIVVLAVVL